MNALCPASPNARVDHDAVTTLLAPRSAERVMRLKSDLRLGLPVVLTHDGEAGLVVAVEPLSEDRYRAAMTSGPGAALLLSAGRAAALGIEIPSDKGSDPLLLPIAQQTGLNVLKAMADPTRSLLCTASILPGLNDLTVLRGSALHAAALALTKSAQLLPALLVLPLTLGHAAEMVMQGLSAMEAHPLLVELSRERVQHPVASARLPMAAHDDGRVHVFRPDDGGIEHYAIEIGVCDRARPALVRLHSACFTGDVLGSLKCDCGPQLHAATAAMAREGGGILLYLNQEGRGIGLANKMRAYALQEQGFDTVEANHQLGFHDDERDFRIGAALLTRLDIKAVRLLTNNPAKIVMLQENGIDVVERVPLVVGKTAQNAHYLATKAAKSGHLLK